MLTTDNTVLLLVDIQGKLAHSMHARENLFENLQRLVKGVRVLELPILWAEQNPKGLGPTIPEVAELLPDIEPIPKFTFSCCGNDKIKQDLNALGRNMVLIAGIETHICVYQTTRDLKNAEYNVQVVVDAVSSRSLENKQIGLEKCKDAGAFVTSVETVLFELLKAAEGSKFKEILNIVK